ncbi:hypothetical protein ATN05_01390 [Corynebacterium pseudotuberculosis]|nr:hypothetical protein ATN05_01390 [Corynebacterium pseudotuberculosis]
MRVRSVGGEACSARLAEGLDKLWLEKIMGLFLTVAEVAEIMRVSKMTVYRLVHSGELPAVRVGRSFRVHEKAVNEYLDASYYDVG